MQNQEVSKLGIVTIEHDKSKSHSPGITQILISSDSLHWLTALPVSWNNM